MVHHREISPAFPSNQNVWWEFFLEGAPLGARDNYNPQTIDN
jgi:hypothetical protein